jgi:hypothetical protein
MAIGSDGNTGVLPSEVTAGDFMLVRAALVRRVGGANEALVWARVFFRTAEESAVAHATESGRWWAASYDTVGAETGLSTKQARGALESLVSKGFLLAEQHRLRNNYDQTYSYQPVVSGGQIDLPSGADEAARMGNSGLPSGANVPISEDTKTVSTKNVAGATTPGSKFAQPLCEVLVAAMRRNEAKVPSPIPKSWLDDARLLIDRDGRDPHQARALIEWASQDSFWRSNILSMPTFRKQYDKLRLASERGGGARQAPMAKASSILDMGERLQAEADRKAVAS